jgi:hypothetical protein
MTEAVCRIHLFKTIFRQYELEMFLTDFVNPLARKLFPALIYEQVF